MWKWTTIIASIALLAQFTENGPAQAFETVATISGIARVKDGDGVLFGRVEVRLQGIAAPEDNRKKQDKGGRESTECLRHLVDGKYLTCHLDGTVARKRPVGICYLGDIDIGEYQIRTGNALDCPRFSKGRYANAEAEARRNGRGLAAIYDLPPYCLTKSMRNNLQ